MDENKYLPIYNSTMINKLMTVGSNVPIRSPITTEKFTFELSCLSDSVYFKPSTKKLLDFCLTKLYKNGTGTTVSTLEEYAELCGRKHTRKSDEKLRESLIKDFSILTSIKFKWCVERKNRKKDCFGECNIFQSCTYRHGKIYITFSDNALKAFNGNPTMNLSIDLFKLDERNRLSYIIGRTLDERYSGKRAQSQGNNDIISVASLLKRCQHNLPKFENDSQRKRYAKQKIIEPIEKALDSISDIYAWRYCNAKKSPLREDQNPHCYNDFIALYIRFEHR